MHRKSQWDLQGGHFKKNQFGMLWLHLSNALIGQRDDFRDASKRVSDA